VLPAACHIPSKDEGGDRVHVVNAVV
jgi:hypothetical protein